MFKQHELRRSNVRRVGPQTLGHLGIKRINAISLKKSGLSRTVAVVSKRANFGSHENQVF